MTDGVYFRLPSSVPVIPGGIVFGGTAHAGDEADPEPGFACFYRRPTLIAGGGEVHAPALVVAVDGGLLSASPYFVTLVYLDRASSPMKVGFAHNVRWDADPSFGRE